MLDKVQIFENQEFGKVRVVDQDGRPWWVLTDVCKALGFNKLLHRLHIQYKVRKTWVLYRWHSDKG